MVIWWAPAHQFEHTLFLIWVIQRGLAYLIDRVSQNHLQFLYQRVKQQMGSSVCEDLQFFVNVKCQYIIRYCFCLWLGAQGATSELLAIVSLLQLLQLSNQGIQYCLGILIYCYQPTLKIALVLWLIIR